MIAHAIVFYIFSLIAIVSAIMVTVSKNTVNSVFFLILDFISISCLFIMIGAEFLGMIMLIVYVGAVAVLFLFVVMMLNVAQQKIMNRVWRGWGPSETLGEKLQGKKVGIVGMGRIGSAVAKRLNIIGMEINYHNRTKHNKKIETQFKAKYWSSLDQMISKMDIISIHCPYTPETFHLLSKRRLKLLKKTSILINTSRGEIVDENALASLLLSKKPMIIIDPFLNLYVPKSFPEIFTMISEVEEISSADFICAPPSE